MSIQKVSAAQLAELFHSCHQALGPDFGLSNRSGPPWCKGVPQEDRKQDGCRSTPGADGNRFHGQEQQDFKPGEAEWGC
jgi:hypothetical protein